MCACTEGPAPTASSKQGAGCRRFRQVEAEACLDGRTTQLLCSHCPLRGLFPGLHLGRGAVGVQDGGALHAVACTPSAYAPAAHTSYEGRQAQLATTSTSARALVVPYMPNGFLYDKAKSPVLPCHAGPYRSLRWSGRPAERHHAGCPGQSPQLRGRGWTPAAAPRRARAGTAGPCGQAGAWLPCWPPCAS